MMMNGVVLEAGGNLVADEKLRELKRALLDTVYGSDFGFRASAEVRSETLELLSQLETANPNPSPVECPELLDGNWVLLFTAFSELFLNPLQNSVAGIARAISGLSSLKIPIRGGQTKSWLLTTYLDNDLRISRGDGGLFVLVKEGSPLLDW